MASSGPGPRDYLVGTERALYAFARTTCYFPGCKTSVIVFVESEPVSNAQIAHIRGANPGSPRYDPAMTDDERRSYANLILLCEQGFVKVSVTVGDRSGRRSAVLGGFAEGRPDAGLVTVRERLRCRRAGLPGAP
jgi:hypothetical protein